MSDPAASPLATQLVLSFFAVRLLELLKRSRWMPWLHFEARRANKAAALLLAALSAQGVHVAWSHSAPGSFGLSVTGITFTAALLSLWGIAKSYAMQQVLFQATVRYPGGTPTPNAPPAITGGGVLQSDAKSGSVAPAEKRSG